MEKDKKSFYNYFFPVLNNPRNILETLLLRPKLYPPETRNI